MGFSLTGTHVIFFIAAIIVASSVSGVLIAKTYDFNESLSKRGDRLQEQLDTDFEIINDNKNIPNMSGYYRFYLKNIGEGSLTTTNETFSIFIDGEILATSKYNFTEDSTTAGSVTTIYIINTEISNGDHKIRVVGPQAVEDEFEFEI